MTLAILRGGRDRLPGKPWDVRFAGTANLETHLKASRERVAEESLSDVATAGVPPDRGPMGAR